MPAENTLSRDTLYSLSRLLVTLAALALVPVRPAAAQEPPQSPPEDDPQRTERVDPFSIIGNIYFVGSRLHYPSYLITTAEGHFLIDSTYEEFVPDIVDNVQKLGFDIGDVRYLLSSHAHHDHVGGHALLREITGATTVATAEDAEVIETGGRADFRDREPWTPGTVDRIIRDGERLRLGDTVLTAHLTPGHTKGCTTWTTQVKENQHQTLTIVESYDVVFLCGVRVNTDPPLVGNPDYPDMPEDFARTFEKLKELPVDVFLGAHGYWYNLAEKRERMYALMREMTEVGKNPYVDPAGYDQAIRAWERAFERRLAREQAARDN